MNTHMRVLLVDQLDAAGAAPEDARARALALRRAGCEVETLLLEGDETHDLQHGPEGAGPGLARLALQEATPAAIEARVSRGGATVVVWASAAPGGGPLARALPRGIAAHWWPTGHAPAGSPAGPLEALPGFTPPGGDVPIEPARGSRANLSLWDGPYVLVAGPPGTRTGGELLAAFADVAGGHDADLVVLDRPRAELESLARAHGIGARAHFVGPAPRGAEAAWLACAAAVLVPGDAAVSGGLLRRALALGVSPVPVGPAGAPLGDWLASAGAGWTRPRETESLAGTLAAALSGGAGARLARERARAAAAALASRDLPSRLAAALGASSRLAAA